MVWADSDADDITLIIAVHAAFKKIVERAKSALDIEVIPYKHGKLSDDPYERHGYSRTAVYQPEIPVLPRIKPQILQNLSHTRCFL